MRTIFTAALLASALATPALAQEAAPFTGPHVELTGGWDRLTGSNGNGGAPGVAKFGFGNGNPCVMDADGSSSWRQTCMYASNWL